MFFYIVACGNGSFLTDLPVGRGTASGFRWHVGFVGTGVWGRHGRFAPGCHFRNIHGGATRCGKGSLGVGPDISYSDGSAKTVRRVGARGLPTRPAAPVGRAPSRGVWRCEICGLEHFHQNCRRTEADRTASSPRTGRRGKPRRFRGRQDAVDVVNQLFLAVVYNVVRRHQWGRS